jgi:hypothetical protein
MKITLLAIALIVASTTAALAGPPGGPVWEPCDYHSSYSCG